MYNWNQNQYQKEQDQSHRIEKMHIWIARNDFDWLENGFIVMSDGYHLKLDCFWKQQESSSSFNNLGSILRIPIYLMIIMMKKS